MKNNINYYLVLKCALFIIIIMPSAFADGIGGQGEGAGYGPPAECGVQQLAPQFAPCNQSVVQYLLTNGTTDLINPPYNHYPVSSVEITGFSYCTASGINGPTGLYSAVVTIKGSNPLLTAKVLVGSSGDEPSCGFGKSVVVGGPSAVFPW